MKLKRTLEPEVMATREEAVTYDQMDHSKVNTSFVDDLLRAGFTGGDVLDLGTGTAQIPVELARRVEDCRIMAVDMSTEMLDLARYNIDIGGCLDRIQLAQADAKSLGYQDEMFDLVMSNSIVHHLPDPGPCLHEVVRVCKPGGLIFIRDLMRPDNETTLERLVQQYTGKEVAYAQQLFRESLHAALTVDEMRAIIADLDFDSQTVQATSDRHLTWVARRPTSQDGSE